VPFLFVVRENGMISYAIFPHDLSQSCTLAHDTAGWTLPSHIGTHPANGAPAQVFDLPDSTPDGNGATLSIPGKKGSTVYHGVLYLKLPTGPGLIVDVFPPVMSGGTLPRLVVQGQFLSQDI
jgi:hypothetical protein